MGVLFLEVNEATIHFVEKFSATRKLPNFARILSDGASVRTHIPDASPEDPRFTRQTSPWIVWPSIYTGMRAATHELIGFGQDTRHLTGKYLWDVLSTTGRSYGVFGSLISFPPRPEARFYVPDSLSTTPDCIPTQLQPLQKFFLFGAHHYSEGNWSRFVQAAFDLLRATGSAISWSVAARAFGQIPSEILGGGPAKADRAMLHSILAADAFERLYRRSHPDFATAHFNHIAYVQHRYWRACEPEKFSRDLSATDRRFYPSVERREQDESKYNAKIEQAYVWTDRLIGRAIDMMRHGDILVIASGLGQRPYDPVSEIHNPVVRFEKAEAFFAQIGLESVRIHYEMNPDLTIDCACETDALRYATVIDSLQWSDGSPLFYCQHRRHQLFLELIVPPAAELDPQAEIRHRDRNNFAVKGRDHVWLSDTNEQSTAHHLEEGLFIIWRKGAKVAASRRDILVTEIAPAILDMFGIAPCDWHRDYAGPIVSL